MAVRAVFLHRSTKWPLSKRTFVRLYRLVSRLSHGEPRVFIVRELTPLGSHTVALKKEPQSFGLWIWLHNKAILGVLLSLPIEIQESIPFGFMKRRWGTGQPGCGFPTRALTCGETGIPVRVLKFYSFSTYQTIWSGQRRQSSDTNSKVSVHMSPQTHTGFLTLSAHTIE